MRPRGEPVAQPRADAPGHGYDAWDSDGDDVMQPELQKKEENAGVDLTDEKLMKIIEISSSDLLLADAGTKYLAKPF